MMKLLSGVVKREILSRYALVVHGFNRGQPGLRLSAKKL